MDTLSIGSCAEDLASKFLRNHGYCVVERNFRCRAGEIDVVAFRADPRHATSTNLRLAREARMLVFLEVRSRSDDEHGDALLSIGASKQRQVAKIAAVYLAARHPDYEEVRFDVVGITGGIPTLIEDAFRA